MDSANALHMIRKSPFHMLDPGNAGSIEFTRNWQYCGLYAASATSGAETRTMLAPNGPGRNCKIGVTYYGNGAITVTVKDSAGNTTGTITFSAISQWIELESIESSAGVYVWHCTNTYGCTTTVPQATATTSGTTATTFTIGSGNSPAMALTVAAGSGAYTETISVPTIAGNATITMPNATATVATLALAETFTNKTLTAPVINGATSASGNFDLSGSTGTFLTSTGAVTIGPGAVAVSGRATFSKSVLRPCLAAVTATAAAAAALTADKDIILLLSVTTATTYGWTLPTGVAGMVLTLINTAAYANTLIPATGGTINGLAPNAGVTIAASKCYIAVCSAADTWHVMEASKAASA